MIVCFYEILSVSAHFVSDLMADRLYAGFKLQIIDTFWKVNKPLPFLVFNSESEMDLYLANIGGTGREMQQKTQT